MKVKLLKYLKRPKIKNNKMQFIKRNLDIVAFIAVVLGMYWAGLLLGV